MKYYTIIAKVEPEKFVKYRKVNNLIRLTAYLDKTFPDWRYFNVFDSDKKQVASFTNKDKPTMKHL